MGDPPVSRIDSDLSRQIVDEALRSDERFVVAHQTAPMFRATVGQLHSEVHALLETLADEWPTPAAVAQRVVRSYAVRRLSDVHRTLRDLDRLENHLRMSAAASLRAEFGG